MTSVGCRILIDPPVNPDVTDWPAIQQTFEKISTNHDPSSVPTLSMLGRVGTVWGHSWLEVSSGLLYSRPASYIRLDEWLA